MTASTIFRLLIGVLRRFRAERCAQTAAALSFATLLGLVPMVVIGGVLIESLPFGINLSNALEKFLLSTLLPDKAGTVIAKYLSRFAHRAESLTWIGVTTLAVTALMQMLTIEHAFNAIWKVRSGRPWLRRLAMHLVALLAGPVVFGAALASITYLAGVSFGFFDEPHWVRVAVAQGVSVFFLALLFALLYWAVPNKKVSPSHAGLSGILVALAFVGMQRMFTAYVVKFPTYTTIYGTFAAVPVFLLWLHLSWSVILVGALLTAGLPILRRR